MQAVRSDFEQESQESQESQEDQESQESFGPVEVRFFEVGDEMSRLADNVGPGMAASRPDGGRSQSLARRSLGLWVALAVIGLIALGISASYAQPRTQSTTRKPRTGPCKTQSESSAQNEAG
jgi:hypothetical protein